MFVDGVVAGVAFDLVRMVAVDRYDVVRFPFHEP